MDKRHFLIDSYCYFVISHAVRFLEKYRLLSSQHKDMRKARDAKNERLFSIEELLTPQQSNSYFSRFAAKRRQLSESEIDAVQLGNAVKEVTKMS